MKRLAQITKRLNRLANLLVELKERVRQAISGELGRIVAKTVGDVVHAVLRYGDDSPPRETIPREPSHTPDRLVSMVTSIDQPTTRREYRSTTAAR